MHYLLAFTTQLLNCFTQYIFDKKNVYITTNFGPDPDHVFPRKTKNKRP